MISKSLLVLPLPPGHVHLWLLPQDEVRNESLLDRYRNILSVHEKARERRFHFAKDGRRYLLTRAFIRSVLSRYSRIEPHEWQFGEDAHGRPYLMNPDAGTATLAFNISHADGVIACGLTRSSAIGIDVESGSREPAPLDVADRYFSPAEVASLHSLPPAQQRQRFFECWVLKESYIKAIGKGLSVALTQMSFDLDGDTHLGVSFGTPLMDHPDRWQFLLLRPFADYLLAICVERSAQEKRRLFIRKLIPFESETPASCDILRQWPSAEIQVCA